MIVGVGIDIQDIAKIARSIESASFVGENFTVQEAALCKETRFPDQHFAGKFATKEAFMKAVGAGIRQGVWFIDIEVLNRETGAPYVQLYGEAQQMAAIIGVTSIHLSITHSAGVAVSVVILEKDDSLASGA